MNRAASGQAAKRLRRQLSNLSNIDQSNIDPSEAGQSDADQSDNCPAVLGQWALEHQISQGQFCQVFRARPIATQPNESSDYVVKRLRAELEHLPWAVEMLQREAIVGRQVCHPHLLPVLEGSVTTAPYFVVMPYLTGTTLDNIVRQTAPLDVPRSIWIARQLADALAALHEARWLHADIKPANVLHSASGHITLLDLGFARPIDRPGCIADRPLVGTYAYVAPELFTSRLQADERSDIYSLGVTLFEMLTGERPFAGNDSAQLAEAILQRPAPDVRTLQPQVPASVSALVRSMLAKEPLRRPQTARQLMDSLVAVEIETFADRSFGLDLVVNPGVTDSGMDMIDLHAFI